MATAISDEAYKNNLYKQKFNNKNSELFSSFR